MILYDDESEAPRKGIKWEGYALPHVNLRLVFPRLFVPRCPSLGLQQYLTLLVFADYCSRSFFSLVVIHVRTKPWGIGRQGWAKGKTKNVILLIDPVRF